MFCAAMQSQQLDGGGASDAPAEELPYILVYLLVCCTMWPPTACEAPAIG